MNIDDLLLVRYVSGETTKEENDEIQKWSSLSEENANELKYIQEYWDSKVVSDYPNANAYKKLRHKVEKPEKRMIFLRQATIIAASLVIGILFGHLFPKDVAHSEKITYKTGSAVSTFVLPDNTEVTLNKNSSLSFNADFGKADRMVELKGEGYFKVKYDNDRKFQLDLDGASVTVLGTVFNASNWPDDNCINVSLVSGSVLFNAGTQSVRLMPEHMITYERGTETLRLEKFDALVKTSWKDNLYRYRSVRFVELIENIARLKDVKVYFQGDFSARTDLLSGSLDSMQSFEQMLSILSKQIQFKWTIENGNYYIYE